MYTLVTGVAAPCSSLGTTGEEEEEEEEGPCVADVSHAIHLCFDHSKRAPRKEERRLAMNPQGWGRGG